MNLPEEFISSTRALMGDGLYEVLAEGLQQQPPVSIRMNPFKSAGATVAEELKDGDVEWCSDGVYLKVRPNFTFDPLLHAGVYYVQEASSMFIQHAIREGLRMEGEESPLKVLDLCAAPGGKSTAVRAILPQGSLLISNEPVRQRAQILAENIQKFGHPDVIVTNNYAKDFTKTGITFDVIICDVPCSGEGMFRKDEGAVSEWSKQNVEKCQQLQREIVSDIWDCLRPEGLLIYSTCTFNGKENEENVEWIASELGAESVNIPTEKEWNITGALAGKRPVYRFLPGKTRGEGLFIAVLKKKEREGTKEEKKNKKEKGGRKNTDKSCITDLYKLAAEWLNNAGHFNIIQENDNIIAIPQQWGAIYNKVRKSLKVVHAGITLGTKKGKSIIPDQSLALSTAIDTKAFHTAEVSHAQAINYLRKETIVLPQATPCGIVLLTYRNQPIGFVKNIGNRANNLYPQEWKIRSSHIPQVEETIINNIGNGSPAFNLCRSGKLKSQIK